MIYPNLKEEIKILQKGYKVVVGFDEAGRGALAGPLVVSGVLIRNLKINSLKRKLKNILREVKDSKKIAPLKREKIFQYLIEDFDIEGVISAVSAKVIDRINVDNATKLAIARCVEKIEKKKPSFKIDYLIIDGKNIKLEKFKKLKKIRQKTIVRADEKVFSCACASIIAKVSRDRIMRRLHKKYPNYGFDKHKGYGTEFHRKMLKKYGPCLIHRKSFQLCNI